MLEALKKIFGGSSAKSSDLAHQRLKFVLLNDRTNISPEIMENIKNDIIQVISKYMEINQNAMEVSLENDSDSVALVASIPVSSVKQKNRRR
ncbi:MAG: cell division topological specificity factor MinE [Schwartzia sp.]|nr:cell division topological specificity factor MinE [Schwartzia sp. (in: firmicutes)]